MKLAQLVETSRRVADAGGRRDKVRFLADLLTRVPAGEVEIATAYLCGIVTQRLGDGRAVLRGAAGDSVAVRAAVQPMLAGAAEDEREALEELGEAALEWKLDGARVQIHKGGGDVRVYSRALNDVTAAVPEVVEMALALPASEIILEGEAIALRDDGRPYPFQTTMTRFGRRLDVERARQSLPITPVLFELLYLHGTPPLHQHYG